MLSSSAGAAETPPAGGEAKVEVDPSLRLADGGATGGAGSAPTRSSQEPPRGEAPDPAARAPRGRLLGLPIWGWLLVSAVLLAVLLLVQDLRNRERYRLFCSGSTAELQQGRTLPWPFGYEGMGGAEHQLSTLSAEADCHTRSFGSADEAEVGLLELALSQARGALASPGAIDLRATRRRVQQALALARNQRSYRREAQKLLADVSYREGRAGLTQAEQELRTALSRFQEAQQLDGERWDDLDEWINLLEEVLRTIAPAPSAATLHSTPQLPALPPSSRPSSTESHPSHKLPPPREGGTAPPADAGPPPAGGGILM